jgi:divinyl chlorophyllide a 8-vinyl-reductase
MYATGKSRLSCKIADDSQTVDAIVSCLVAQVSRRMSYKVIIKQHSTAAVGRAVGAGHFVVLSAFASRIPGCNSSKPNSSSEAALQDQTDMTWSIIRLPFFRNPFPVKWKSSKGGAPYVMFGDGKVTHCNPISESG